MNNVNNVNNLNNLNNEENLETNNVKTNTDNMAEETTTGNTEGTTEGKSNTEKTININVNKNAAMNSAMNGSMSPTSNKPTNNTTTMYNPSKNTKKKNGNGNGNGNKNSNNKLTQNNIYKNEIMNENKPENNNNVTKVESLSNDVDELKQETNTSTEMMTKLNGLCMNLLNHQVVVKLFHFQTDTYGAHKASDAYLEKYALNMDRFLEVLQGVYGKITLKKYMITGVSHTNENINKHLNGVILYLEKKINDILGEHTELINIRDELLSELEQLKYLLTFI